LSVELSSYPFIERTQKMNVSIDMDQELSKRIVVQIRNGQHYSFSLKRLKLLTGTEQLTSLTVFDSVGDCTQWSIPADLKDLRKELYGSFQSPYRLCGVVFRFQAEDLKERLVYLYPPHGEHVKLHMEMSSTKVWFCLTAGLDSALDPNEWV
jgi:hypothetical protein